jgi:Zn-dependent peptidase ImmA (M78 family)
MNTVTISTEVLRWAMSRAGQTPDSLLQKLPRIQEWIDGKRKPTMRQLETVARATMTPLGYFFLDKPPEDRLPIPHFRTLQDETPNSPSPGLLETVQTMQLRQSWLREYLIELGQDRLPFVQDARIEEPHAAVAERMRQTLGFDEMWAARFATWTDALRALREAMESIGITVVVNGIVGNATHRKLDPSEFRGFVLVDEYAPLVFVNGADGKAAQMFTTAHELAHVLFGKSAAFDLRSMQAANNPLEQACNRVAAEFLVPERQLRLIWLEINNSNQPFQEIARRFKVSEIVAARRALDLGLINKATFLDFYERYESSERTTAARTSQGGDFYRNQNYRVGKRFAAAVVRAAREGKLLYSEAFQLTGLYGETFDRYAVLLETGSAIQ